jgi:hypothetical protein
MILMKRGMFRQGRFGSPIRQKNEEHKISHTPLEIMAITKTNNK